MTYRNPEPYCYLVIYCGRRMGNVWAADQTDAANKALLNWGYCTPEGRRLVRVPSLDWRP